MSFNYSQHVIINFYYISFFCFQKKSIAWIYNIISLFYVLQHIEFRIKYKKADLNYLVKKLIYVVYITYKCLTLSL